MARVMLSSQNQNAKRATQQPKTVHQLAMCFNQSAKLSVRRPNSLAWCPWTSSIFAALQTNLGSH